jgi:hypothetical protein
MEITVLPDYELKYRIDTLEDLAIISSSLIRFAFIRKWYHG